MEVTINDKKMELAVGATLADALAAAGVAQGGIAKAVNGTGVPGPTRNETVLSNGDNILIIKAFYGG